MSEIKKSFIKLTQLPHQDAAIKDIMEAFPEVDLYEKCEEYQNPLVVNAYKDKTIKKKITIKLEEGGEKRGKPKKKTVVKEVPINTTNEDQCIDVDMATGTGKTYTYTKTMFELNKRYGYSKFIVIVPTSAIKVGTKASLTSDDYRRHFSDDYGHTILRVGTIDAGDFGDNKKKKIPPDIGTFADPRTPKTIDVLLLNYKGFLDNDASNLFKDDYDVGGLDGLICPAEMIARTRPVVIIDEPHKMKRDDKAYVNLLEKIRPQMIMRFGATFPEVGTGKNKITDYYKDGPHHKLTTYDAFEQGLVKGVIGNYLKVGSSKEFYKVKNATKQTLTLVKDNGKEYSVGKFEKLSEVLNDSRFEELEYAGEITDEAGGNKCLRLSSGKEAGRKIRKGMILRPSIFTEEYQRQLISEALDKHFEVERRNFTREGFKVKTNALFFIDQIGSYRSRGENSKTWLKDAFEEILGKKLDKLIENETDEVYKEFLQASRDNIEDCNEGYFAEDVPAKKKKSDKVDKVADRVGIILKDKEKTLTFKNEQGNWNLLRFFFSKWTLREGWDNPNVFTICKLRSSGSDSSKIQEVGRGLRLPVDESGNRLNDDCFEWDLNYIVDDSESDFVDKLCSEVNETAGGYSNGDPVKEEDYPKLKKILKLETKLKVEVKLAEDGITDEDGVVLDAASLNALLGKRETSRVRGAEGSTHKVKLRRERWDKLKDIWRDITRRYMITFKEVPDLKDRFEECINFDVFHDGRLLNSEQKKMEIKDGKAFSGDSEITTHNLDEALGGMDYNVFLRELSNRTCLPINILHPAISSKLKEHNEPERFLNGTTIDNICEKWEAKFAETYRQKFEYRSLDFHAKTSVYDYSKNKFIDEVPSGSIGTIKVDRDPDDRWLYDEIWVDAERTEKPIALINPSEKVEVFGKIPRRAIQIPLYTGGTTSPDFVYLNDQKIYLIIEAKANELNQRKSDEIAVKSQEKFIYEILDENVIYREINDADEASQALAKFATGELERNYDIEVSDTNNLGEVLG